MSNKRQIEIDGIIHRFTILGFDPPECPVRYYDNESENDFCNYPEHHGICDETKCPSKEQE